MTDADPPPPAAPPNAPLVAWDAPATAPPAAPLVAWAPPPAPPPGGPTVGSYAGGSPPFTVGALLKDTFARYGADFVRLFLVAAAASAISWVSSYASMPAPGASPFVRPTGFVDVSGLLGLASFVIGLISGATLIALAEGGRELSLGRALRRGVERAGWVFLTSLILITAFVGVFLLTLIPTALFAVIRPVLAVVPILILFAVFIWASLRLSLAVPATVADNLNSIEALKLSWRVTRPISVWPRLLGAALLFGLLFLPAAFGTLLLVFPAMFGSMFGTNVSTPVFVLFLVPAVLFSIFTPLIALLGFSAYRRLVPPMQPSWTVLGPGPGAPTGDASEAFDHPTAPVFRVPRLGTAAKALLALLVVADVAGVAAIPYGVGEMARFFRDFDGLPGFPPGGNFRGGGLGAPGQVTFSTDVDLDTCTLASPLFIASRSSEVEWLAIPEEPLTPQDEVFLRRTRDGQEVDTTLQHPATSGCVGSDEPATGLQAGVYTYELIVNGSRSASGTLLVQ